MKNITLRQDPRHTLTGLSQNFGLVMSIAILLSSCVQPPVFKDEDHALLDSSYPIVAINGRETKKTYHTDIKAGETTVTVIYNTYQFDHHCTFRWNATAGIAYDITDQENRYPLTLYRWHRRNGLWAVMLDPMDPLQCEKRPRCSFLSPDKDEATGN